MKKHLLLNQSFGTVGSPNQTGETQPIDTNETEAGRQNNRRVEFTIL